MPKYVIVTGGSRGIGKATIQRFLKEGWQAINLARTACDLPGVKNIEIDLTLYQSLSTIKAPLENMLQYADSISLIHNAAYYEPDCVPSLSLESLLKTLDVNVLSPVMLNKMIIPWMKPGSAIIYIGSTLAEKAVPGSASYTISKHALVGLMKATCQDLIDKKVHTCCVCPGLVDTQLLKETMDQPTMNFLLENKVIGKRLINPEEIANVIYFCATNMVINGVTLHANMGQVAE